MKKTAQEVAREMLEKISSDSNRYESDILNQIYKNAFIDEIEKMSGLKISPKAAFETIKKSLKSAGTSIGGIASKTYGGAKKGIIGAYKASKEGATTAAKNVGQAVKKPVVAGALGAVGGAGVTGGVMTAAKKKD